MNRMVDWQFEVKDFKEDERRIIGIATSAAEDRVGDVVEPMGAKFESEIPLFLYHDSRLQVGTAKLGKPTKNGIPFEAMLPKVIEDGSLKELVDEAWQRVKYGLLKKVSIGFRVLNDAYEIIKETGGLRFLETEILELSLVPVPANPQAAITAFKSLDQEHLRAVSGNDAGSKVVRLKSSPGVPGTSQRPKDTIMKKTYQEQLAAFEAKSAADQERMDELMSKAADEGRTLTDDEKTEFTQLESEVKEVGEHIVRLKAMAERSKATAAPVTEKKDNELPETRTPAAVISVKSNLPAGIGFARYAKAMYLAGGNPHEAIALAQANPSWKDQKNQIVAMIKTAIPAADTTTSGWASELVYAQDLQAEFIEYLRPRTIIGQINDWRRVPFNVRMGSMTGGATGYWVGQGKPIPMSKGTTSSTSLGITKAAGMCALDEEIIRSSSPSAEMLVRDELSAAVVQILDTSLIDPNQGGTTNVQPAALTYGRTAVSATGTNYAALSADIQSLLANQIAADVDFSSSVLVMTPTTALALSLMVTSLGNRQFPDMTINGGTLFGLRVIVSRYVGSITGSPNFGNMIVLINPREVFLADDGQVAVEVSREASIEMSDAPTNQSTSSTTATSMISMFQTHSMAMKAVRFVNWTKRRSTACDYIRNALYA